MDCSTIIEGNVKFRDGKKWKSRWCVMRKLSPVADCLHLQLYRDSRDRYKQGLTKASLSLQHFLGLETGFTLDKESNTVAIICQDIIVVLAFDTRERLIQWQVKIYTHLGEDEQYLIQICSSPPKAKLSAGPAKLHIQDHRFCLTIGVPPKLFGNWQIKHLRRFGVVDGKFCFEGGSLCGRGEGLYVFLTDQAEEIAHHVQLAAEGKLKTCKRASLKNLTVARCESPRKSLTLRNNESQRTSAQIINDDDDDDDVTLNLNHNHNHNHIHNGSGTVDDRNVRRWPSIETQVALYGHADTSSLADFAIDSQNGKVCNWRLENQLMGRCVSCAGKLGLISRCSTAANTPGSINFNPWSNDDSKLYSDDVREEDFADELNCRCNASSVLSVSHKSKYSDRSSSSGRTECSDDHSCCLHSSVENISKKPNDMTLIPSSPPSSNFATPIVAFSPNAPSRPPKPQKYSNLPDNVPRPSPTAKKTNKTPMPLPGKVDGACGESLTCCYRNYNSPLSNKNQTIFNSNTKNTCSNASQFYDTPRNMKRAVPITRESFSNYDVPPSVIHHVYDHCSCASKTRLSLRADNVNCNEECLCCKFPKYSPVWLQMPPHHIQSKNHWPNVEATEKMEPTGASDGPVYAQVDLSKKLKNRLNKESVVGVNSSCTNVRFDDETVSYDRLANLNYMNLEFTHSLRHYENVRELIKNNDSSRIDSLNIDLPSRSPVSGACCLADVCCRCGYADEPGQNIHLARTSLGMRRLELENYVPMSPLRSAHKLGGKNTTLETLSLDRRSAAAATAAATKMTPTMMMMMMMIATTTTTTTTTASTTICTVTTTTTATATVNSTSTTAASSTAAAIAFAAATTCDKKDSSMRAKPDHSISKENDTSDEGDLDARKRSNSIECDTAALVAQRGPKASLGDSDSGLESDKLSQENDDIVDNLRRRKVNQFLSLRRFAGNGCKAANTNRDSSSSNDSGFSSASFKYACGEFSDFEMPLTTSTSAKRHHSFNQRCQKSDCVAPRRSKSSDPLRDLTFHFHQDVVSPVKSSSAEAELPLCLNARDPNRCKDCSSPADTSVSTPYVDCRSTSSGTSDMSDYIETLSLSSHSSADVHSTEAVKLHHSVVTTLKPRSGVEYQKIDRSSLLNIQSKMNP